MTHQPGLAYLQPDTALKTPRAAEYEIIARITADLVRSQNAGAQNRSALLAAVLRNERLWSTLASDVADPANPLPSALRARLFYLYRFTAEHSHRIRTQGAEAGVLIDINRAVMRGLRGEGVLE